jgi:formate dehydrogenase major subunit
MAYDRLDKTGLQWPCPTEDHPGSPILHIDTFPLGPRARLHAVPYRPTQETVGEALPFLLMTGRSLYQFNAGTMTGRTLNNELRPTDVLDISLHDAERMKIRDGDGVRIVSRYGEVILPAHLTSSIQSGQLFATFQRPDVVLNEVTSPHRDPVTGTPEYKVTAVRIERA